MNLVKPNLEGVLGCYLSLMNELDNEELVSAFENVVSVYHESINPHAAKIVDHLKKQYIRLIGQEDEDDGDSILAAVASFTSIRRILDAV
jgi:hypothetical protein